VTQRAVGRPDLPPARAWYVLRTRSRFEFAVRDQLRGADIEEFLPVYREEIRWSDRTQTTTRPLFAGYIFCRFDPSDADSKTTVLQTRGFVTILSLDSEPVPIPDECIADLRRIADSPVSCSPCAYVVGERVRVERGPFAGIEGVVTRVKGVSTLTVPIEIMCRSVSVQIDAADVEAATEKL
jgi:transcription antitermination factor NusG